MTQGDKIKYGAIAGLTLLLFLVQWYYSGTIEDLRGQIEVIKLEAQQAEIEAMDRQREVERAWQAKADQAAKSAAQNLADVQGRYDWAVARLDFDGMHADGAGGGETALPGPAATSGGADSTGGGQCSRQDTRDIKAALLTVARDCDITATRYNELLRLWQGVR